jgi:hypothetical protein
VHAAQAAGGEDADPGGGGQQGRAGHRRGSAEAEGGGHGEVADPELGQIRVRADPVHLGGRQTDVRYAVQHRDGRRDRATRAHRGLDVVGRRPVVRPGQPVGEQGALQGDDRLPGAQRVGDLRGENGAGGQTGSG